MAASGKDDDRTVVSDHPLVDTPPKKRSPWMWVGLGGCAAVLCLGLVVVAAVFLIGGDGDFEFGLGGGKETPSPTTEVVSKPTPTKAKPTKTPKPTPEPTATEVAPEPSATKGIAGGIQLPTATPTTVQISTATPTAVSLEPAIGPITFATGVTDDSQPVGAGITFPGDIEEIHAIFSYEGMSESDTWERYWYQDEEEAGVGSGPWDAGESGTFDLSLTGGGEPLGAGIWELEIYVNGELAQSGTFIIQASATPPTKESTSSPPVARTHKIAFARWDGGKHNLYIANTDGSGEQFLWERAAGPSWSSDGQHLSFYGEEGVDRQVRDGVEYVVPGTSNGILWLKVANFPSDITQVETGQFVQEGTARWTAWSPSGDMLAFDAARGSPDRRVYFLGTADNQQFSIEIPGEQADWSPKSDQVVYRSGRDGKQGIWISNRDDSGAHNISNEGSDSFPSWSPDGGKIAFHRESEGNVDIYVMNVDGSNVHRLTDAPGPDTLPAWTPDSRGIVFRSARAGSWGIYIMNADGSGQEQIIANADPGPDWSFGRMDVH